MATHRYQRIGVILATVSTLLVGGSVPVRASLPTALSASSGIDTPSSSSTTSAEGRAPFTYRIGLAAHRRAAARRLATSRSAAHRRALVRTAALRSARAHAVARQASGTSTSPATSTVTSPATRAATRAASRPASRPAASTPSSADETGKRTSTTLSGGSPSGQAAPHGDLPGWHQKYVEDFATDVATGSFPGAYASHWYAYADGVKDTSRNGTYMPSKVLSVHDGVLDYAIHSEGGQHLVSAPVMRDTYGQVYGRYSVRFRSDQLGGYKNAWLLWPDSGRWPDDGEIDGPEGDLDGTINAFSHFARPSGGQDVFTSNASFSSWHTVTIEWVPGRVTFHLDGAVLGTSTQNVPTTAMHWVLQTETSLGGSAPANGVAGHVLIDWVALYARA